LLGAKALTKETHKAPVAKTRLRAIFCGFLSCSRHSIAIGSANIKMSPTEFSALDEITKAALFTWHVPSAGGIIVGLYFSQKNAGGKLDHVKNGVGESIAQEDVPLE
jgi:hypothetical protein